MFVENYADRFLILRSIEQTFRTGKYEDGLNNAIYIKHNILNFIESYIEKMRWFTSILIAV